MLVSGTTLYYQHRKEFEQSLLSNFKGEPQKLVVGARQGSIKLVDGLLLRELVRDLRPARILEVGSFLGFSTRWLLEAAKAHGGQVTALDPGIPHRMFIDTLGHVRSYCSGSGDRLSQKVGFLPPVRYATLAKEFHERGQVPGSLAEVEAYLRQIPVIQEPFGQFDFAFIDGDHEFSATFANVGFVARMMTAGGVIVVHDAVTWPDVQPALAALCAASRGALELVELCGQALHDDMVPYFERRMTPPNAKHAANSFSNGMAVVQVHRNPGVLRQ